MYIIFCFSNEMYGSLYARLRIPVPVLVDVQDVDDLEVLPERDQVRVAQADSTDGGRVVRDQVRVAQADSTDGGPSPREEAVPRDAEDSGLDAMDQEVPDVGAELDVWGADEEMVEPKAEDVEEQEEQEDELESPASPDMRALMDEYAGPSYVPHSPEGSPPSPLLLTPRTRAHLFRRNNPMLWSHLQD